MRFKLASARSRILFTLATLLVTAGTTFAQSTTFTYQGRLTDQGAPASGTYDLRFRLFDEGEVQQGPDVEKADVQVTNGVFTVQLNFGSVFDGDQRYLEIAVRPGSGTGTDPYTPLTPRQEIFSTPYAVTAFGVSPLAGASVVTAINASGASIDAARLPSTLATQNGSNTFSGTNTFSTSPTFSAGLSAGNQRITSVGTPTAASDAATKAYVDANIGAPAGSFVQLAPATQQTATTTNHLINLKLIGSRTLGQPGQDALLSLSASGTYKDNSTHDKERFRVDNDGSILSVADYTGGINTTAPIEGAGTRFMWYATKAALRAGEINGTQWDDANIGLYSVAFGQNVRALGDNSIAVGKNTVAANTGTVALGEGHTATGANSIALGYGASTSTIVGSPRLGTFVFSDRSVPLTYSFGGTTPDIESQFHPTVTNSFNVRAVNGSFFYTNTALTTGFIFNSTTATMTLGNSKLTMASDGSTTLTSNSGGSTGVTLPAGGGSWNNLSDRNMKANFAAVNTREILRGVLNLPISTWNYKTQNASIRHIGPMAQDFFSTFRIGESDKTISTIDPDGVAFAAIQGLNEELKDRDVKIEEQKRQLDKLQQQVKEQQAVLDGLRQLLCQQNPQASVCKIK